MKLLPLINLEPEKSTLEEFNLVSFFPGSLPPTATEYLLKSSTSKTNFAKPFSRLAFN
jgi:hypothetical protein